MVRVHRSQLRCLLVSLGLAAAIGCQDTDQSTEPRVESLPTLSSVSAASAPRAYVGTTLRTLLGTTRGQVDFIDTESHTVVRTVPVRGTPVDIEVSPDGAQAWVLHGPQKFEGTYSHLNGLVTVIDITTGDLVELDLPGIQGGGHVSRDLAISPDGSKVYVATPGGLFKITGLELRDYVVEQLYRLPRAAVAFTPNGEFAYVTQSDPQNFIDLYETSTDTWIATIRVPTDFLGSRIARAPTHWAFSEDGSRAFMTYDYGCPTYPCLFDGGALDEVYEFDTSTHTYLASHGAGISPGGLAVTPAGIFVANTGGCGLNSTACGQYPFANSVSAAGEFLATEVSGPWDVAATPDGNSVYVTSSNPAKVSVFNLGGDLVTTIPLGEGYAEDQSMGIAMSVYTPPATPSDRTAALIDDVQALLDDGALTDDQAAGLFDKLNEALFSIEAGRTVPAVNQLNAFIRQVEGFRLVGILTDAQAAALEDAARATIDQLLTES